MDIEIYSDIMSKNLTIKNKKYLKDTYFKEDKFGDWIKTIRHILKYYNSKPILITNLSINVAREIFNHTNKLVFPILIKSYKIGGSYNSSLFDEKLVELYLGMSPATFLLYCKSKKINISGNLNQKIISIGDTLC